MKTLRYIGSRLLATILGALIQTTYSEPQSLRKLATSPGTQSQLWKRGPAQVAGSNSMFFCCCTEEREGFDAVPVAACSKEFTTTLAQLLRGSRQIYKGSSTCCTCTTGTLSTINRTSRISSLLNNPRRAQAAVLSGFCLYIARAP